MVSFLFLPLSVDTVIVEVPGAGTVANLEVPDVALARNYVITVEQIASSSTFALLDPGQVRIRVVHSE